MAEVTAPTMEAAIHSWLEKFPVDVAVREHQQKVAEGTTRRGQLDADIQQRVDRVSTMDRSVRQLDIDLIQKRRELADVEAEIVAARERYQQLRAAEDTRLQEIRAHVNALAARLTN